MAQSMPRRERLPYPGPGEAWLARGRTNALFVPSALCLNADNVLIASARIGFRQLRVRVVHRFRFDQRLIRSIAGKARNRKE